MAYQRLVMCVDSSGSTQGEKIKNSVHYLTEIAKELNCTTNYYTFGTYPYERSGGYSGIWCYGGTKIEYSLNDLFVTHLQKYSKDKQRTKFIFVTDAEGKISDEDGCISSKKKCETSYDNKLDSYCLITGSGACRHALKRIFGANSFDHCPDNETFKEILKKICGNNQAAHKLAKISEKEYEPKVQALQDEVAKQTVKLSESMDAVSTVISISSQKTESAAKKIDKTRQKLKILKPRKIAAISMVDKAHSEPQIDAVEAEVDGLKDKYREESNRIIEAGKELEEARMLLDVEKVKAEQIREKMEETGFEIRDGAKHIICSLMEHMKELEDIQCGAYEQVKMLRSKFRNQLENLMFLVQENEKLHNEFIKCQRGIDHALKSYSRKRFDFEHFRQ
eukprot:201025_1